MKNPFKMKNVVSSATAIFLGGLGNVGMNYLFDNVEFLQKLGTDGSNTPENTKNAIKIAVGAIGGAMVPSKYGWAKSALDGTAIVGASELISDLIDTKPAAGLPEGTIGRVMRMGQRGFRRASVRGVAGGASDFMGA